MTILKNESESKLVTIKRQNTKRGIAIEVIGSLEEHIDLETQIGEVSGELKRPGPAVPRAFIPLSIRSSAFCTLH